MRSLLALIAVALVGAPSSPRAPQAAPDRFSVVIDYTATGWSAKCETGCSWEASFSCATACDARVDGRGIVTLAEGRPADSLFYFIVERTRDGVRAQSRWGTAWKTLSWSCGGSTPCPARITDTGVWPLARR